LTNLIQLCEVQSQEVADHELHVMMTREWRLLDHTIITAAIVQWRSRLNACVRVNGGHFEHKFLA